MADSAEGLIKATLDRYGLGSLATWAWVRYQAGDSIEEIMLEMRTRPEYKARFPAMETLGKEGRGISEEAYIEYERGLAQLVQAFGLPTATYTSRSYVADLLTKNVSLSEAQDRMELARAATTTVPAEYRSALTRLYGVTPGQLTSYWLETDRTLGLLEKQFAAAQVAGEAAITSLGELSQTTAERLVEGGLTREQARQGFTGKQQFAQALPGEIEAALTPDQVALGVAGIGPEREVLMRRARQRAAAFASAGSYATTQEGTTGLGTTSR